MIVVGIAELKARLSQYVRLVREGAELDVRDRNESVARLVAAKTTLWSESPKKKKLSEVRIARTKQAQVDVVKLLREERGDR